MGIFLPRKSSVGKTGKSNPNLISKINKRGRFYLSNK